MVNSKLSFLAASAIAVIAWSISASAMESTIVLHSFDLNGRDGVGPSAGLIADALGNLYGTTSSGGTDCGENGGCAGTVFELSPADNGRWNEKVLHTFRLNGTGGTGPAGSVILDGEGNLYGATYGGGRYGVGTAFELSRGPNESWMEKILHSFGDGKDGVYPSAGLALGSSGNLYGTTADGGTYNAGTVFELSRGSDGVWHEKVIYSFKDKDGDGMEPQANVVVDGDGNLYGTTTIGGSHGLGIVFELSPTGNGAWSEKVLHRFKYDSNDGANPYAGLIMGSPGHFYGTTANGGLGGGGTVFEVEVGTGGNSTEKVLHSFTSFDNGVSPMVPLAMDAAGNLYVTTAAGGSSQCVINGYSGCGSVFQLTPQANGRWAATVLHLFNGGDTDGSLPEGGLVLGLNGDLYGTTFLGGRFDQGTVFEIAP
jgi:uncharacterized repeat protein (TIGR03803 family)